MRRAWRLLLTGSVLAVGASATAGSAWGFPGANGRLAYVDGPRDVFTVSVAGGAPERLTNTPDLESRPRWSADGNRLAYERAGELYVSDADGGNERRITSRALVTAGDPAWSPDRTRLVFAGQANGLTDAPDLYLVGVDGRGLTNITPGNAAADRAPAWSPDGTRIAFASNRDGRMDAVYTVRTDGTEARRVAIDPLSAVTSPTWSPDGSQLAWENGASIEIANADGTARRFVTFGFHPSWSPNGQRIAFHRPGSEGGIWTVVTDGSGARRIVESGQDPDWQPVPGGDATPPETSLTRIPEDPSPVDVSFEFAASEAGATFECQLDGSPSTWAACGSPQAYRSLQARFHFFAVRATDPAGNTDLSPARHSWTVSGPAPPETLITAGPLGAQAATEATFEFRADLADAAFRCRLDQGAWTPCTSPRRYTRLRSGRHVFAVGAIDPAGAADPSPATREWTVVSPMPALRAGLARAVRTLTRADPRALARTGLSRHRFAWPAAGRISVTWTAPSVAAARRASRRLVLATGARLATRPGPASVVVRFSKTGRRLLRTTRRIHITLSSSFAAPATKDTWTATRRLVLPRTRPPLWSPPGVRHAPECPRTRRQRPSSTPRARVASDHSPVERSFGRLSTTGPSSPRSTILATWYRVSDVARLGRSM